MPRLPTKVGLLIALAGPPLFIVIPRALFGDSPGLLTLVVLQVLYCLMAAAVILIVIRGERLPLSSIGLRRPSGSTVIWGLSLAVLTVYLLPVLTNPLVRVLGLGTFEPGLRAITALPAWFRVTIGATGGVIEETLYRGYAIERLTTITGSAWLGAAAAVTAFTVGHIPMWGLGPALGADLPFGVVMTLFYLWRRDLAANAIGHSAALVVGMLFV